MAAQPFQIEILSDDEEEEEPTPIKLNPKRRRRNEEQEEATPTIFIIDDDPTPKKPNPTRSTSTPSFVPETPLSSDFLKSDASIVKCTEGFTDPKPGSSSLIGEDKENPCSGINGLIFLESDKESGSGSEREESTKNTDVEVSFSAKDNLEIRSSYHDFAHSPGVENFVQDVEDRAIPGERSFGSTDADHQVRTHHQEEDIMLDEGSDAVIHSNKSSKKNTRKDEAVERKRKKKEEQTRLAEERKLKREQDKLQKQALKAEAAEMKQLHKEQKKWENGKLALNSIVAEIDSKVVELGSIGGALLSRLSEKGLTFRVTSNPIGKSILWKMTLPEQISKISSKGSEVPYILLVYEADEFCNLVIDGTLFDDVSRAQSYYPSYTICYLINKLKAFINKREQAQYKDPANNAFWRRPPVEEVLSKLTTDFARVHSRQCVDEAELAEHVVGLTSSLANCQFRKKLTRLSVTANGALIPKDFVDKELIKKNVWLKALIAIPKVQPRFAVAIWKKYPTMKSLLSVYMDPSKTVHEKEFLLRDLQTEGLYRKEDRRVGEICSKRVYRILMAQNGNIKTDDVEVGADFFRC